MKKMLKSPKISVSVVVSSLDNQKITYELQANAQECKMLATRFDIPCIKSFKVDLDLYRDEFVHVVGKLWVVMQRESVISMKKFDDKMTLNFDVLYSENPPQESDQIVDPIENGRINLGDVVAEQFGLNLDPFPHAPDEQENYVYMEDDMVTNQPFKNLEKILKK